VTLAASRPGIWGAVEVEAGSQPIREGERLSDVVAARVDIGELKPKLADYVEVKEFTGERENYTMLANNRDLLHYRFEPGEAEIVKYLDGTRTVKEIVVERFQESGDLDLGVVADLVTALYVGNFLDRSYFDMYQAVRTAGDPDLRRRQKRVEAAKSLTLKWENADRPLRWMYRHGLKYLVNKWTLIFGGILTLVGGVLFVHVALSHRFGLESKSLALAFILLTILNWSSIVIHEIGHGVVLVRNGRRIRSAGIQMYFGAPALFVDSSDGLMMERKQRMAQVIGGPFAEAFCGAIVSIFLFAFPDSSIAPTLYKFAVLTWLTVFLNLIPLLELDGYFLLSEAIQISDLRPRSIAFVQRDMWIKLRRKERFSRPELGLAAYGILGFAFTIFCFFTSYFVWKSVFGGLVSQLWNGGTATRIILIALALVLVTPVLRGLATLGRAVWRRVVGVWRRVVFRIQTKWRVEAASLIDGLPMFEDLPEDVLSDLAGRVKLLAVRQGQTVVRQGERADAFYIVRKGTLQVVEEDLKTEVERVLRTLGRGESFGELGLVESAPRAATVRATTHAELFEVDKGTFDRLLADMINVPDFAPTLQAAVELKEISCFAHLEPDELGDLIEQGEWISIAPGEVVIEQGAVGDAFYGIRSGQVEVERDEEIVGMLGAGRFFGEIALLLDVPRTATVRARTPVRAFRLDRPGFDNLVADAFKKGTLNPNAVQDRVQRH
jgi:CRP-like cAMP-binding protein/Zn-dependent protease